MKKFVSLNLWFLLILSQNASASTLMVNEVLTTKFRIQGLMEAHLAAAEEGFNSRLKKYDCLMGSLTFKVTKKSVVRLFRESTPGEAELYFQTKCFNSDLKAVSFGIDSFGWEEDNTVVSLKVTMKNKVSTEKFCVTEFGGRVECSEYEPDTKSFSVPATTDKM